MTIFADGRVPVIFGTEADAGPEDAVLRADGFSDAGHVPGCACCAPRGALAQALGALFLARMRGEIAHFRRVVVISSDVDTTRAHLAADPLVAARFRLADVLSI